MVDPDDSIEPLPEDADLTLTIHLGLFGHIGMSAYLGMLHTGGRSGQSLRPRFHGS